MEIKLSAVIITFNEEKNIERCIESLRDVSDEILVVDSFSTDATKKFCTKLGVRFLEHPFKDYISQKNYAVSQASYDHILSLDADEMLDKTLQQEIHKIKQNGQADGYTFNRLNNYCGKWIYHCGWYFDHQLRLFDRRRGRWVGMYVHESVELDKTAKICHVPGNILHYTYSSISEHIAKTNRYTTIQSCGAFKQGKKSSLCHIILRPSWKFFRDYILKMGFLDGKKGFYICIINALYVFLKYVKLEELDKKTAEIVTEPPKR